MHLRLAALLIAFFSMAGIAHAHDTYVVTGPQIVQPHQHHVARDRRAGEYGSVFGYSYRGFFAGGLAGLGVGYVIARADGVGEDDWRTLVFSSGTGALSGAALGLTLGLFDRDGRPSGYYVARDMSIGAGFGALAGATAGGLSAVLSHEGEHILMGAAVGVASGAALGIISGLIEAAVRERPRRYAGRAVRVNVLRSAATATLMPGLTGTF